MLQKPNCFSIEKIKQNKIKQHRENSVSVRETKNIEKSTLNKGGVGVVSSSTARTSITMND